MANEQAVRALRGGTDSWSKWRKGRRGAIDLRGADLTRLRFSGGSLINVDFDRATLCGADLRFTTIEDCALYGGDLSRADLRGADIVECALEGAALTMADLTSSNFVVSDCSGASFEKASLVRCVLRSCELQRV